MAPASAIEAAVDEYVEEIRENMKDEFEEFLLLPTDEEAVTRAALAQLKDGKRHPHQCRDPGGRSSEELQAPARQALGAPRGGDL
jgi:hypothetical protein